MSQEPLTLLKIGRFILRLIYGKLTDEIAGDLEELYYTRVEAKGKPKAILYYLKDVLLSFRNLDLGFPPLLPNTMEMFKSYFQGTFRSMRKHRSHALLNLVGLVLGLVAFLLIDQYLAFEKSFDRFHTHHENLYRITYKLYHKNELLNHSAAIPPIVAPFMKSSLPGVRQFARAYPYPGLVISYGKNRGREDRVFMVDPSFLQIFTFPMVEGDPATALLERGAVIISGSTKKKYFGSEPALGQTIAVDGVADYKVTGVFQDIPVNSHLQFDFLFSYETIKWWSEGETETNGYSDDFYSYLLLEDHVEPSRFMEKFTKAYDREWGEFNRQREAKREFELQPITSIHLHSHLAKEPDPRGQGDPLVILFLGIIAYAILFIAWSNYVNLSTARALDRAKEVGVRKVLGAQRAQLIQQFLVESGVMNLLALAMALGIVVLTLPYFNSFFNLQLDPGFLSDGRSWRQLLLLLAVGTLFPGLYPAFVLSAYRPVTALSGKGRQGFTHSFLRKVLVVSQFVASVSLVAATMIIFLQLRFMKAQELGFDHEGLMVIRGPGVTEDDINVNSFFYHNNRYLNALASFPEVLEVSAATNVPGEEIIDKCTIKIYQNDMSYQGMPFLYVGYNYFSTLGIDFVSGRTFSKSFLNDTATVILNEAAIKKLGFREAQDAIGEEIIFGSGVVMKIIGVVQNYHQRSTRFAVTPMVFALYPDEWYYYLVKFQGRDYPAMIEKMSGSYKSFYPDDPFDFFFLDQFYDRQYQPSYKLSKIFSLFALFTILIACLGLYGLASFSASKRTKEIGIRKILGADVRNIITLISKEFLTLVTIAYVIACPLVYYTMTEWLANYATRIIIGPGIFLFAGIILFLAVFASVGFKTYLTARSNPIHALKEE